MPVHSKESAPTWTQQMHKEFGMTIWVLNNIYIVGGTHGRGSALPCSVPKKCLDSKIMFKADPERGQIKVPQQGFLNQLADSGWRNRTRKDLS